MYTKQNPDYVYTVAAVRGRFRRGAKSVLLFMPYTGRLVRVTRRNIARIAKGLRPC